MFNVKDYGAKGDGVTNDSAAVQTLLDTERAPYFPPGTYVVSLTKRTGVPIIGADSGVVTLIPPSANTPIFSMPSGATADYVTVSGFTLKAHASGSTGAAVISGTPGSATEVERACLYQDIVYQSNGSGNFTTLYALGTAYGNVYGRTRTWQQSGPTNILTTGNGGAGISRNPNQNFVRDWSVYANNNITTIVDAGDSTMFIVENCHFEANTGATVLIPGNQTRMSDCWLEANASASIVPAANGVRSVLANGVILSGNYYSDAQTLTIPAFVSEWEIEGGLGSLTVTDNGGGTSFNAVIAGGRYENPQSSRNSGVRVDAGGVYVGKTGGSVGFFGANPTAQPTKASTARAALQTLGFLAAGGTEGTTGATGSVPDGGTITHGLGTTPTSVIATGSVANQFVSVTAIGATTFTVAIKTDAGRPGTAQMIYWRAQP